MKTSIATSLITGGIILLVSAFHASAQDGRRLIADVPFEFYVKDVRLPAGKYEFFQSTATAQPSPLVVRTLDGGETRSVVAITNPDDTPGYGPGPIIVFNQYGGRHFLSALHSPKAGIGLRIVRGPQERSLAKNLRQTKTVTVRPVAGSNNL